MNSNIWNKNFTYDVLIIGSGMGGSALAYALKDSGLSVLMVERGDFIKQEKENWDVHEIVENRRYASREIWIDRQGQSFTPRMYYNVGGNSKFFGGTAFRLRESDFRNWPVNYSDFAPWYEKAEELLGVRGKSGEDPTEPPRKEYPFTAASHEQVITDLAVDLEKQGLHPFHLPIAIDQGPGGKCRKGSPCDGFPCMVRAKGDGENRFLRPLYLKTDSNLTLLTGAYAVKLLYAGKKNLIEGARILHEGKEYDQKARLVVVSAGAVNSAALLLRSRDEKHKSGAANTTDLVGRNYMSHINSVMLALSPLKKNPTVFQKTLGLNDFYERGWGNIQLRGKIQREMLKTRSGGILKSLAGVIAPRSIDLWLMTEDPPERENRIILREDNRIQLSVEHRNTEAHRQLISAASRMMRKAGYPLIFVDKRDIRAVQHQCGTIRFGRTAEEAPLDPFGRSWDHPNLFVVDASFFPTSGAVNPALTIAAQGLRAGDHISRAGLGDFIDR